MQRPKKIYYVGGLISLCFLFPVFISALIWDIIPVYRRPKTMPYLCPDKNEFIKHPNWLGIWLPDRKVAYSDFQLTGNEKENTITLDFLRLEIKRLKENRDTSAGMHFTIANECRYGTYVKLLNMLNVYEVGNYLPSGSDVWIIPVNPPRNKDDVPHWLSR
jgi:hypothetical protein